jgi:transmembrane 9 superfamily protein 2/4
VQIGTMLALALIIYCFGFFAESPRGSLLTMMLFLYTFMSIFAGYFSTRLYKMFDGSEWIKCASWTAISYPSVNLLIFSLIKAAFLFGKSSNALAPSGMLILIALWLGISMPLVFLGSWIGYKKCKIKNPCKFSETEQSIKPHSCWLSPTTLCILGGIVPFGAIFVELVFIMMSIWRDAFYYLYGYLFICLLLQAITSAEISVFITYAQLSRGNHKVWWSSFLSTGSVGLYIFGYSIFFYATELDIISFSSSILYFGCMLALSLFFSLFCGSIGFFASHWFTRKIYGTLKTSDQIELDEQKSPESFGYETFVEQSI